MPLNSIDKHVGGRVRMRRMMLGVSQTNLGDALGIAFRQVQKYENGTNRVSASRLQHISHILQVPISFFFEEAPPVPGQYKGNGATAPTPAATHRLIGNDDPTLGQQVLDIAKAQGEPGIKPDGPCRR